MPTWGEIFKEFDSPTKVDPVRRQYLFQLAQHTGRDTILYSTKWTDPSGVNPDQISITEEDIQGFMEVVHGLKNTDLVMHNLFWIGVYPGLTKPMLHYMEKVVKSFLEKSGK